MNEAPRVFLTPGPSQLHPRFKDFMAEAIASDVGSISHRSKTYEEIYARTETALRTLLNVPQSHQILFLGSATEAMERLVENCARVHTFHLINGEFSKRFYQIAVEQKKNAKAAEVRPGEGFDLECVSVPDEAELVCLTQNETSTGAALNVQAIHGLKERYSDRLFAVDIVSSAPFPALSFDLVDSAFFSVQKAFALPAGLGVLVASNRAIERARQLASEGVRIGSYHSLPSLADYAAKRQNPETPNVIGIYLLGRVAEDYLSKGIDAIRAKTETKAQTLYSFLEDHETLRPFVRDPQYRSQTVITIEAPGRSLELQKELSKRGLEVGLGYGSFKNDHLRVANFPVHTIENFYDLIDALS